MLTLAAWPLIGRDGELDRLRDVLAPEARCVVVTGPAGVGKTRLMTELAHVAEVAGRTVACAVASRSAATVPFGALAPLLPTEHVLADTPAGLLRRAARAIRDLGGDQPVVLLVDDAHTVDEASATLLYELAVEGGVSIVLTVRDGEKTPAPIHRLRSEPELATTLSLGCLDRRHVERLIDGVLEGPVDGSVAHRVWESSQGNPLYVRELLVGSVETSLLERDEGMWRWRTATPHPERLAALVESRLSSLGDEERRCLEVLAVAKSSGRDDLEGIADAGLIDRLVDRGLVVSVDDGTRRLLRLSHPVYEETLLARMTRARSREVSRQIADATISRGARRRGDHLRVATLLLEAGGAVEPDLLEAAAREAYLAYDLELTERVARAAIASGAGPGLRRVLGEILRWQGRYEEAEALLADVDLAEVDDEGDAALAAIVRAECLYRGMARHEDADAVLVEATQRLTDPAWRAELLALRGEFAALAGQTDRALELALPVLRDDQHPRASVVAAGAAVPALLAAGRADDGAAIAERAFAVALGLGPQPAIAHPALQAIIRIMALAEAGRLDEATSTARTGYDWSLESGFPIGQAWFGLALGRCELGRGQLVEAHRLFSEAALGFRDLREHGLRMWALAGLGQAAAAMGHADAARHAVEAIQACGPTAMHLAEAEIGRAVAAVIALDGEHSRATEQLIQVAERARSLGQHGFELAVLHDVVRLGHARKVVDRVQELSGVQGPLAEARAAHTVALAARDVAALEHVSTAFEELGAQLLAAEVAAQAAAIARVTSTGSGPRLSRRADQLAADCAAASPALSVAHLAADLLTPRELEIALLAAQGLSNPEIGDRLAISRRTVGNLLQRAYSKLHVRDRTELAEALESARQRLS